MGKDKAKTGTTTDKPKVESVRHSLPASYDGRCKGVSCIQTYLSKGAGEKSHGSDGKRHSFEILLPLPTVQSNASELYGDAMTNEALAAQAVGRIATIADESVKAILFGEKLDSDPATVTESDHLAAQVAMDAWAWTPQQTGMSKSAIATTLKMLVTMGRISQGEANAVETADDLDTLLRAKLA